MISHLDANDLKIKAVNSYLDCFKYIAFNGKLIVDTSLGGEYSENGLGDLHLRLWARGMRLANGID